MGKRRRSAARASPARVAAFSLTSNRSRARCHSSRETMGGRLASFSLAGLGLAFMWVRVDLLIHRINERGGRERTAGSQTSKTHAKATRPFERQADSIFSMQDGAGSCRG